MTRGAAPKSRKEWHPPTNADRATWGELTVKYYTPLVGNQEEPLDWQVVDLLTDLMHFAQREGLNMEDLLRRAGMHFDAEVGEEKIRNG